MGSPDFTLSSVCTEKRTNVFIASGAPEAAGTPTCTSAVHGSGCGRWRRTSLTGSNGSTVLLPSQKSRDRKESSHLVYFRQA